MNFFWAVSSEYQRIQNKKQEKFVVLYFLSNVSCFGNNFCLLLLSSLFFFLLLSRICIFCFFTQLFTGWSQCFGLFQHQTSEILLSNMNSTQRWSQSVDNHIFARLGRVLVKKKKKKKKKKKRVFLCLNIASPSFLIKTLTLGSATVLCFHCSSVASLERPTRISNDGPTSSSSTRGTRSLLFCRDTL